MATITTTTTTTTTIPSNPDHTTLSDNYYYNSDKVTTSTKSTPTTPQHRPRRRSMKKSASGGNNNNRQQREVILAEGSAQQRRVLFSRSRSLSECRQSWAGRDGMTDDRKEGQSQLCRVRSFKSTRKGLVRNGESFKSTDTTTFMSTGSVRVYRKLNMIGRSESIESTDSSVGGSSVAESYYRVGVLGTVGVGKSTLIRKFLASEEHTEASSQPNDSNGAQVGTVSVLLDGQESLLEFWDCSQEEETVFIQSLHSSTTTLTSSQPSDEADDFCELASSLSQSDAYTIVFALNDPDSFRLAGSFLRHLREEKGTDRAITLVGNKSDLVRQRHVSDKDACALAHQYDCKYIETSAVLGHQTDELLVGTLRQIRLKLSMSRGDKEGLDDLRMTPKKHLRWQKLLHLYRFLHGASQSVDSCQNFFV